MSINNLKDIFADKGKDTLHRLLNSDKITVYEKLDGLNFGFKFEGNDIIFFKRNANANIGDVDRTLTAMYEKPINYIQSLRSNVKEMLKGHTFGFYYFPSVSSSMLSYDELPTNNLVLSYVNDSNGRKILDKSTLDSFADALGVARVPIIFEGKLTSDQISSIYKYMELSTKDKEDLFGELTFAEHLYSILTPTTKRTILNKNLKSQIESLIFRFDNGDGDSTYSKIVNPYFDEIIANNKSAVDKTDNMYYLILSDIMDFLLLEDIQSIKLSKHSFDDRYVELICKLFNKLIKIKGKDYSELIIDLPEYLEKHFNHVNYDKIENEETKRYVLTSINYKEIFRIFLASFRKKRRSYNSIFNQSMNKMFNGLVDKILEKCALNISADELERQFATDDSSILESFIDFDEFERIYVRGEKSEDVVGVDLDVYLRKVPDYIEGFIESDFDMGNFTSSILAKTERKPQVRDSRQLVNLLIDTFDPMSELVYEFAKFAYDKTKIPSVIVCVGPRNEVYSDTILEKVFTTLTQEEYFENYILIERPNIKKVIYNFEADYKVNKILANANYMQYIEMQLTANYRDNNYLDIEADESNVSEYYHDDKSITNRSNKALSEYNFLEYKKYTPEAYCNLFNDIYKNYKHFNNI